MTRCILVAVAALALGCFTGYSLTNRAWELDAEAHGFGSRIVYDDGNGHVTDAFVWYGRR